MLEFGIGEQDLGAIQWIEFLFLLLLGECVLASVFMLGS